MLQVWRMFSGFSLQPIPIPCSHNHSSNSILFCANTREKKERYRYISVGYLEDAFWHWLFTVPYFFIRSSGIDWCFVRVSQNLKFLYCAFIFIGNFPVSALHALLLQYLFTPSNHFKNLIWTNSAGFFFSIFFYLVTVDHRVTPSKPQLPTFTEK